MSGFRAYLHWGGNSRWGNTQSIMVKRGDDEDDDEMMRTIV